MVFFSTWICIPVDVVLCDIPLLWELLSQRSKRESWTRSCSDSCFDLYRCCAHCCGCYSFPILVNMKPPQLLPISASSTKLKLVVRLSLFPVHEIYSFHAQGKSIGVPE